MNIIQLFSEFSQELQSRKLFLTEDSVRYIWYSCMLRQDSILDNYVMEVPYDMMLSQKVKNVKINQNNGLAAASSGKLGQELDMLYDGCNGTTICLEIKFHRTGGLNSTYAHTDAAGRIFNDIRRLQLIQPANQENKVLRLFVYVADDDMRDYLSNAQNVVASYRTKLSDFYRMPVGVEETFEFGPDGDPETFIKSANSSFSSPGSFSVKVEKLYERSGKTQCESFQNGGVHVTVYSV